MRINTPLPPCTHTMVNVVTLSISAVLYSFGLVVGEYSTLRKVLNSEKM